MMGLEVAVFMLVSVLLWIPIMVTSKGEPIDLLDLLYPLVWALVLTSFIIKVMVG